MASAVLDVLTPRQFAAREDYRLALETLCKYPSLVPDVFDAAEPVRMQFDQAHPDRVADTVWEWGQKPCHLIWKRRKPKSWGALYPNFSPTPRHVRIHFDANVGEQSGSELVGLLKEWSCVLEADFAFLEAAAAASSNRSLFANTRELLKSIPQLYWATIFGAPYVRLFGRERLEAVPAAVRTELAPNLFYVQLTERLQDVIERPEAVDAARQAAKEHLGLDAFVIAPGASTAARLPTFSFATPKPTG
jgi:hypothetical protein